ncbi:MAG: DNA mismatch repair endonuclease MutL [Clostridia bacterium]|nr:DNA mismatch repair endonuclease MutL [Clostridia bacterium]
MAKINVMPKHLAELIAAGEVVERPASIVKELLENAVDAGADTVTLEIRQGGISYIRISDNGSGIEREDIRNAFVSHATSKIKSADDLNSILTLGFRGEALASIAAVARVEVLTAVKNEKTGTRYSIEYGEEILLDDAGCPEGTTITVRDLFLKTPARMKFLKKDVTEANAVASAVDRIALSHPEVSFRFIRDGKQALMTSGKGDLLTCIREVLGKEFATGLIPCRNENAGISVSGYISKPQYSRPNRNMQFFFLNGRFIRTGTGSAALSEGYRNSIMVGKFPSCIINIEINPSLVDVNVHPAKTEVRFSDEKPVFNAVFGAVKTALDEGDTRIQAEHIPSPYQSAKPYTFPVSYTDKPRVPGEQIKLKATPKPAEPVPFRPMTEFVANAPSDKIADESEAESDEDILLNSPAAASPAIKAPAEETVAEAPVPVNSDEFEEEQFRLIGEAFMTYIICEYKKKLIIIDKHAAHERIIYERLKKSEGERTGQILLAPVTVNLPKDEYAAVLDNLDIINSSGFEIEDFGGGSVLVRECPMELSFDDVPGIIAEIAGRFVEKRQDVMFEKLDWIFHSVACRSAIKAGNVTSRLEMEKFAKQLLSMPEIRYCPHGRPVLIEMTQRELEKNFGRIQ